MTDTPLIRAAKALADALSEHGIPTHLEDDGRLVILQSCECAEFVKAAPLVRAVLEAVREPSEAVADAGMDLLTERGCNPLTGDAEAVWQAMINAALSE